MGLSAIYIHFDADITPCFLSNTKTDINILVKIFAPNNANLFFIVLNMVISH